MALARFQRNWNGQSTYICRDCGKRTRETGYGESSLDLCLACYDRAGWENSHSDDDHGKAPVANCPFCQEEAAKATA